MVKKTTITILSVLLMASIAYNIYQASDKANLFKAFDYARADLQDMMKLFGIGKVGSTHQHADFKVYVNGKAINFSQAQYQVKSSYVHVEEGIGDVMHVHANGITLQHFFNSVGIILSSNCITLDRKKQCSTGTKTLKYYVNGQLEQDEEDYQPKDFDKILISYGDETDAEIQEQMASITNLADNLSPADAEVSMHDESVAANS